MTLDFSALTELGFQWKNISYFKIRVRMANKNNPERFDKMNITLYKVPKIYPLTYIPKHPLNSILMTRPINRGLFRVSAVPRRYQIIFWILLRVQLTQMMILIMIGVRRIRQ